MEFTKEIKEVEIDNELRCSECNNYLTCRPIMMKPSGDCICGRCSLPNDEKHLYVRNNAYESLAKDMTFNCRYCKNGCSFKGTIQELEEHEPFCSHHKFKCPVLPCGSCHWCGSRTELVEHFKTAHPELILKHPCDVKPNIQTSYEKNMITTFADKLFLIQIKYNNISAKFWYGVRLIDNPSFTKYFEYKFEILSEKGNWYSINDVLPQEFFQIYCDVQNEIDFNSLLSLLGSFEKLTFQITIIKKENVKTCLGCKKNFLPTESSGQYCPECSKITTISNVSNLNRCSHCSKGCLHSDTVNNLKKHEAWFCEHGTHCCKICNKSVTNAFDHYFKCHQDNVQTGVLKMNDLRLNTNYSAFLVVENAMFLCLWKCTQSYLDFKVISNMTKTDNCQYDCILNMINPKSHHQKKYKLLYSESSIDHDWLANIRPNSNNPFIGIVTEVVSNSPAMTFGQFPTPAGSPVKKPNVYSAYKFEFNVIKKTKIE